jgi:uncharacterized membrane protein YcaP (DUF421 family)
VIRRNMRKVLLTQEELMSHLRLQGVHDLADVERSYMENDGRISVVERTKEQDEERTHHASERQSG